MTKTKFQRLPINVVPSVYNITIHPDLKKSTFVGSETIDITVVSPTKVIVLNSIDLVIKNTKLVVGDKTYNPSIVLNEEEEILSLNFDSDLPTGKASLSLDFSGVLNDRLKGLYRSRTSTSLDEVKYAAVTQFAPTDARRCFPCWDEPAVKAVFVMTISAPNDAVALSNMPCVSEQEDGDRKIFKFAPSPIMSTYLVAIIVGNFDYLETKSSDGVLIRVYTPPGVKEQGKFAIDVAKNVLPFYKDYFKIAYPLPKLDIIAVADLSYSAMENWGLVTFRQSAVLIDEANSATVRKQCVALVIGHELAHQWFGNIVTMEWWTDLWLNEGFASFIENLCTAHLFPNYQIWNQFVSDVLSVALELDCLETSHPIEVPVNHPNEINEIFDAISYNKGASIIRMLHNYIGDDDFREGMNLYLTRHQYKNTSTADLWAALGEASSKPVGDVMTTWTKQMGYPLVKITSTNQEGSSRVINITQEKFIANPSYTPDSSRWLIPITVSCQGREKEVIHSEVVSNQTSTITIPNVAPGAWIKLNHNTTGVYRVQYSDDLLQQLLPDIVAKSLPPIDRVGILDDLLALVKAGRANSVQLLNIISAMRNEDELIVWRVIANSFDKLNVVVGENVSAELKKLGCYIFKPTLKRLGWESKPSEGHMDALLRPIVILKLGAFGDKETIEEAQKRFKAHLNGERRIPADLRTAVYSSVLQNGDEEMFNSMLKLYREETLQEERDRILSTLGVFKDPKILAKGLDFVMTDEVRAQDKLFLIVSLSKSRQGRDLVWEFIKTKWSAILTLYKGGFLLSRLISRSLGDYSTEGKAEEIQAFFRSVDTGGAERCILQTVESIMVNAAWAKKDAVHIEKFLTEFKYD